MHRIEILLPLHDNDGQPFRSRDYAKVRNELVERFGGITAFTRAPAEGLWERAEGERDRDEIVIFEVMADHLDREWWRLWRARLERDFRQEEIVIRAHEIERL